MVTMTNPLGWFAALMIGSIVDAVLLLVLKKQVDYDDVKESQAEDEKDIDLSDIKIS